MSGKDLWRALGLPELRTAQHREHVVEVLRMGVQRLPVGSPWVVAVEPLVRPVEMVEYRHIAVRHDSLLFGYYEQETETHVRDTEDGLAQYLEECFV